MEILKDKSKLKTLLEIINKLSLLLLVYFWFSNLNNKILLILAAIVFSISFIYLISLRNVISSHKMKEDKALEKTNFWVNMMFIFAGMILVYVYATKRI